MDRIIIADTTLRDGEQSPGCQLDPTQKLVVARQLERLGVDVIEAGFPVSSPAEFEAVRTIADTVGQGIGAPQICAFGRAVKGDIDRCWDAIQNARHPRIHTFIATSDIHLEHKLRMSRSEALERAANAVRWARAYTDNVQFSPEDAFRSDRVYLAEVVRAVIEAGAAVVNITDTVGYATPEEFGELVRFLKNAVPGLDRVTISVHCHDDLGMAVANSLAAVKAGARQIECTMNGIGERAGNCSLEEAVMAIKTRGDFFGANTNIRTHELARTSALIAEIMGMPVPPNKAVVGANAFAHASGIHQDGMIKHALTYEIMRPEDVGAGQTKFVMTARSGRRALETRLKALGFPVPEGELEGVYQRFKNMADGIKVVTDQELKGLMSA